MKRLIVALKEDSPSSASLLCATVLALQCAAANAATYYADASLPGDCASGNYSVAQRACTGTDGKAWATLNRAVRILRPGDTLLVRGGTYAEWLNDNIPSGTSWSMPVTLKRFPGETATLRPAAGAGFVIHFANNAVSSQQFIVIDGLVLDGINISYSVVKITYVGRDISRSAHHIRLVNVVAKNGSGSGIIVGSKYNEIIGSTFQFNGRKGGCNFGVPCAAEAQGEQQPGYGRGHDIYLQESHNLIDRNMIHDNGEYGLHAYNCEWGRVDSNVIRNNVVFDNGKNSTRHGYPFGLGMIVSCGAGNIAYNNVVFRNRGGGVAVKGTSTRFLNNTVYGNTRNASGYSGVYVKGTAAVVQNNISFGNGGGDYINISVGTVQDHNLFGIDPKFRGGDDFHLQPGSRAIDQGASLSAVACDFGGGRVAPCDADRRTRPRGRAYDIGAYEFGQGGGPASPTGLRVR